MRTRTGIICAAVFAATICTLLAYLLWPRQKTLYRVTILPSLGGKITGPEAINDRGQIVGFSTTAAGDRHLFLWDRDDGMRDLGPIDGPADINNEGQIAGTMRDPNGERRAFLCTPGTARRLLGTLGGSTSIAMAINNRGQVVGESWTAADLNHAFLWDQTHGIRDLNPPGTRQSHAYAINDRGQVMIFSPQLRVSLWDPNEGVDCGDNQMSGAAFGGINNQGLAVLARRLSTGKWRIMASEAGSGWRTLRESEGNVGDIRLNDANQVLFAETRPSRTRLLNPLLGSRPTRSCLMDPNGGVVVLDRYVPCESDESFLVQDLNNRGSIIGALLSRDGQRRRGVLLEPIPRGGDES